MEVTKYLPILGALITTALGIMGLVLPNRAAKFISLEPQGLIGWSEIRATYGGFFLLLGLSCLYLQMDIVYFVVGLAWVGAAIGRTISVVFDKSTSAKNFGGIAFESLIATTLLCSYVKAL
ncbi:MAG: DUF4345 family protein [Acidobacteria bacterium]|nr:DUF4345 family protein [Acidobacteriota bacterium]